MKTKKKITIGVIVAFLAVVMVGYIYLFTGAKIKNVSNDVIKGDEETKSLVVYFTRQGVIPGDVDAVSSATQSSNKGMEGSDTEGAARMIQSLTGADMYQIYTSHYYRRSFVGTAATAWIEERLNLRPELAAKPDNLDDYDTIYVGTPTWWYTMAPAVLTFLTTNDFTGKTVIPFMTNGGWPGHVIKDMEENCKGAAFAHEMQIQFDSKGKDHLETSEEVITEWIGQINTDINK